MSPLLAGPFQSEWDATVPYVAGNVVFDRGGWWLRTALNPGTTNSRPISGTTDWTLVAGTPYVDVTLDPVALTSSLFQNNSDTTSGIVVIPAPGVGLRAMPTAVSSWLPSVNNILAAGFDLLFVQNDPAFGGGLAIVDAPGCGRSGASFWNLAAAFVTSASNVAFGDENQDIRIETSDAIAQSDVDAPLSLRIFYQILPALYTGPTFFHIVAVNQGTKTFVVNGDGSDLVTPMPVIGSTGNNGSYTVVSKDFSVNSVLAVNQGTKTVTIGTDETDRYFAGQSVTWADSTGNDGTYTVASSSFSTPNTLVVLVEAIPDATADGTLFVNNTAVVVAEAIPDATADGWAEVAA